MSNHGRITKKIVKRLLAGEELDLSEYTAIEDSAAESISKYQGDLNLVGLTSLSDAAAKSLSKHEGELSLTLEILSESAADILREHPSFCGVEDSEDEDKDGELTDDDDWEDSNEDQLAGEEPIEGVFDPEGWELLTSGKVSWSSLLEVAGPAREASLVTKYEWQAAQRENRVLTIVHTGNGMCYAGKVGLHVELNYCRVILQRSLPQDIDVTDVCISDIEQDFAAAVVATANATQDLMQACSEGNLEAARQAILRGADCSHTIRDPEASPLKHAITGGHLKLVQLLLESGATNESQIGAWRLAIAAKHPDIVEFLSEHYFSDVNRDEALLHACRVGADEAAAKLLADVKNINGSSTCWEPYAIGTPLTVACGYGHKAMSERLLNHGASAVVADSKSITPWVAAASGGHDAICVLLESKQAKKDLNKALTLAIQRGRANAAQALIEQGADPNSCEQIGSETISPLVSALTSQHFEIDDADEDNAGIIRMQLVELLLSHGGDPNTKTPDGESLLHLAVRHAEYQSLQLLAKAGADLEVRSPCGMTPLIQALRQGRAQEVFRLLMNGSEINVTDSEGTPALLAMFAESSSINFDVLKWLIAFGVDLDAKDANGWTVKQHCEQAAEEDDDEFEFEDEEKDDVEEEEAGDCEVEKNEASKMLQLLEDSDLIGRFQGVLRRPSLTEDDFLEQLTCAIDFLESDVLAGGMLRDWLEKNPHRGAVAANLMRHADRRYRSAVAIGLWKNSLPPNVIVPILVVGMGDLDDDVRDTSFFAALNAGATIIPELMAAMANKELSIPVVTDIGLVIETIAPDQLSAFRQALSCLIPDQPLETVGLERLRVGSLYSIQGKSLAKAEIVDDG